MSRLQNIISEPNGLDFRENWGKKSIHQSTDELHKCDQWPNRYGN